MIELHAFCGYPSFKGTGLQFEGSEWAAQKFIKTIKGLPFNGYADVLGTRLRQADRSTALNILAAWSIGRMTDIGVKQARLVPIPSSSQTGFDEVCTARLIADHIAARQASHTVLPLLAFKAAHAADHLTSRAQEGEPRRQSYDEIRNNLRCAFDQLAGPVILVDDVYTTGKHVRACADLLRDRGATVEIALCAGKTIWDRVEDIFSIPTQNVDFGAEFDEL